MKEPSYREKFCRVYNVPRWDNIKLTQSKRTDGDHIWIWDLHGNCQSPNIGSKIIGSTATQSLVYRNDHIPKNKVSLEKPSS